MLVLSSDEFAQLFVKLVASQFGIPKSIISDRDPRWTYDFWKRIAKYIKIEMWLSTSYYPQYDRQTKVANKQLETILRAYIAQDKKAWGEHLPLLEFAYNNSTSSSTGQTPFFLYMDFIYKTLLEGLGTQKT